MRDWLDEHNWIFEVGGSMKDFLWQYGGFIIGFLFMPVCSIIRKLIKKLIKRVLQAKNSKI
jgi:hypothetical protein